MVKPMFMTAICALFLSAVVGVPLSSPQNSCKDLAEFVQGAGKLPAKPEEDGVVTYVSGWTAKKMFPGAAKRMSIFKKYTFASYFNTCKAAPAYTQVQVKSGPYKLEKTSKFAYDLGLQVGMEANLANVFKYLPNVSVKAGVSRGYESVEIAGIEIKAGELKQECVVSPGWWCTAYVRLDDFNSGEIIINDRIRDAVFFPASLNGKNLYSDVWLDVPGRA
ncbi:hypothetical protein BKA57DRAFT_508409 [Linnemannia elongata]|nr:hypothetical protein BGZ91_008417 [Linnemannia elongata]KAG0045779.1 hypothetical protein BGZ90_008361 [Linnemannia elongata]KAG0051300.1 hypothetical protein BGZ89_003596 [Linnemannia elongata]KAH7043043.1 hypothetical protein BKA57DRAFT_508409 [Linnemannia elongata]